MPKTPTDKTIQDDATAKKPAITNPAMGRLMMRARVKRISSPVYTHLHDIIDELVRSIIRDIIIFVKLARRGTIQIKDVDTAFLERGITIAIGRTEADIANIKTLKCQKKKAVATVPATDAAPKKKTRRSKANSNMDFQQKNSDLFAIPKKNFDNMARSCTSAAEIRFSKGVVERIQVFVEHYVIGLCVDAYRLTKFANRDTIQAKDISLAMSLRPNPYNLTVPTTDSE